MNLHDIYTKFPKEFPLPFILDGATGTALMSAGMPQGECPECWIAAHPEVLSKIQKEYYRAGSDAVYTPTFGANRETLLRNGIDADPAIFNETLGRLSTGTGLGLVGGDLSPTGCFIEPYGDTPFETVVDIYAEQARGLDRAGVDFFVCETCIDLNEARATVLGIKSVSDKPVFVTLTTDADGRTLSGDTLLCGLLALSELGVCAFGSNCSMGPADMLKNLLPLVPYSVSLGIPLIAKPNAGMPHENPDGSRSFDLSADEFGKFAVSLLQNGIHILGGCCGTDGSFIEKLNAARKTTVLLPRQTDIIISCSSFASTNRLVADIDRDFGYKIENGIGSIDDYPQEVNGEAVRYLEVEIRSDADADAFLEAAPYCSLPVLLKTTPELYKKVLRRYCGKPAFSAL